MFKAIARRMGNHSSRRDSQVCMDELIDRGYGAKQIKENLEDFVEGYLAEYSKEFRAGIASIVPKEEDKM